MNVRTILSAGLLITMGAHAALAQEGKSRAEVRAELDEAIQNGSLLVAGEIGLPRNQLRPDLYPRPPQGTGKSREEVKAELSEAIRTGDIIAGESSYKLNEIHPNLYPPVAMHPGKTREEAKAELAEALRTGEVLAGGEALLKRNQLYPWSYREENGAFSRRASAPNSQPAN